jgi:hypothetical protein
VAITKLGYKGAEVGRHMGLSAAGVSLAVGRGEVVVRNHPGLEAIDFH